MTFAPGDSVHVAGLGKGVIREVRNGRRYLVDLKGQQLVASESQLTPIEPSRTAGKPRPSVAAGPALLDEPPAGSASLDLHGHTVAEALEALNAFLNSAILQGHGQVQVIHGRSGGKIKAAVHGQLRAMPSIQAFRLDPANNGVTLVKL